MVRDDLYLQKEKAAEEKPSRWRFGWLVHLLLFAVFQGIFILTDESEIWAILGLNKLGEWFVSKFHVIFDWFQLYHSERLNYVTVVWGGILAIHGVVCILEKLSLEKR